MAIKRKRLTPDERYLYSEAQQFSATPGSTWARKIFKAIPALENRACRVYFFGQFISQIGNWLQAVAQGWLVLQMTNSAFWVGVVAASQAVPALLLSLFGGVIVDHFPKKKILLVTNTVFMLLALILGVLALSGHINIAEVIVISFMFGLVNSIASPAHYTFIGEIVDKTHLPSAMSLNAAVINIARIIGPSLAGLFISLAGNGGAFILNGFSFIPVVISLLMISVEDKVRSDKINPLKSIKAGINYSIKIPMVKAILMFLGVISVFGWSYTTIMPIMARNIFQTDASGMGILFAATGLGAVVATVFVSSFTKKFSKLFFILFGNIVFAFSLLFFSQTKSFLLGAVSLFFAGGGIICMFIVLGTMVQSLVLDEYRGRVLSIYFLIYMGLMPLGNLEIGFITERFGPAVALRINSLVLIIISIYIYTIKEKLRGAQKRYVKEFL